jgi:single-strand DNA-binding protein
MNNCSFIGNLTRDVQLRYTQSGTAIADIGVAVNNREKDGDEWVNKPCFLDVTVFGKRAEWIASNLQKGEKVGVTGRLVMDQWTDKNTGQNRIKHKVVGEIHLIGSRSRDGIDRQPQQGGGFAERVANTFGGGQVQEADEHVPF